MAEPVDVLRSLVAPPPQNQQLDAQRLAQEAARAARQRLAQVAGQDNFISAEEARNPDYVALTSAAQLTDEFINNAVPDQRQQALLRAAREGLRTALQAVPTQEGNVNQEAQRDQATVNYNTLAGPNLPGGANTARQIDQYWQNWRAQNSGQTFSMTSQGSMNIATNAINAQNLANVQDRRQQLRGMFRQFWNNDGPGIQFLSIQEIEAMRQWGLQAYGGDVQAFQNDFNQMFLQSVREDTKFSLNLMARQWAQVSGSSNFSGNGGAAFTNLFNSLGQNIGNELIRTGNFRAGDTIARFNGQAENPAFDNVIFRVGQNNQAEILRSPGQRNLANRRINYEFEAQAAGGPGQDGQRPEQAGQGFGAQGPAGAQGAQGPQGAGQTRRVNIQGQINVGGRQITVTMQGQLQEGQNGNLQGQLQITGPGGAVLGQVQVNGTTPSMGSIQLQFGDQQFQVQLQGQLQTQNGQLVGGLQAQGQAGGANVQGQIQINGDRLSGNFQLQVGQAGPGGGMGGPQGPGGAPGTTQARRRIQANLGRLNIRPQDLTRPENADLKAILKFFGYDADHPPANREVALMQALENWGLAIASRVSEAFPDQSGLADVDTNALRDLIQGGQHNINQVDDFFGRLRQAITAQARAIKESTNSDRTVDELAVQLLGEMGLRSPQAAWRVINAGVFTTVAEGAQGTPPSGGPQGAQPQAPPQGAQPGARFPIDHGLTPFYQLIDSNNPANPPSEDDIKRDIGTARGSFEHLQRDGMLNRWNNEKKIKAHRFLGAYAWNIARAMQSVPNSDINAIRRYQEIAVEHFAQADQLQRGG